MSSPPSSAPTGCPTEVTIYEVGPRDGLQNEKALVPTDVKAEFVRRLLAAGLPIVEATSFVHPKWVPQLADAAELMELLGEAGRDCPVLVPNERGLDRALELGAQHIAIFGSATETFAQKNLNRSLDEQFAMFEPTVRRARDAGLDVRAYVSMCFGDPWEGGVPVDQVVGVGKRLFDLGASQLSLGDTIGVGTAGHVTALVEAFVRRRHGRSTSSRCTSTTPTARRSPTPTPRCSAGITTYDASAGGLGGCPYAEERHRQPRDRGPGLDAAPVSASRPASTSSRSSTPASGWRATSGRPEPVGRRTRAGVGGASGSAESSAWPTTTTPRASVAPGAGWPTCATAVRRPGRRGPPTGDAGRAPPPRRPAAGAAAPAQRRRPGRRRARPPGARGERARPGPPRPGAGRRRAATRPSARPRSTRPTSPTTSCCGWRPA